jgi:hypothetical protein
MAFRIVKVEVDHTLTVPEKAQAGQELTGVLAQIENEEADLASQKQSAKLVIASLQEKAKRLRREIDTGVCKRMEEAQEFYLPKIRRAVTRNPETMEIVGERPMTVGELEEHGQMTIMEAATGKPDLHVPATDEQPEIEEGNAIDEVYDRDEADEPAPEETPEEELEAARERLRNIGLTKDA